MRHYANPVEFCGARMLQACSPGADDGHRSNLSHPNRNYTGFGLLPIACPSRSTGELSNTPLSERGEFVPRYGRGDDQEQPLVEPQSPHT